MYVKRMYFELVKIQMHVKSTKLFANFGKTSCYLIKVLKQNKNEQILVLIVSNQYLKQNRCISQVEEYISYFLHSLNIRSSMYTCNYMCVCKVSSITNKKISCAILYYMYLPFDNHQ